MERGLGEAASVAAAGVRGGVCAAGERAVEGTDLAVREGLAVAAKADVERAGKEVWKLFLALPHPALILWPSFYVTSIVTEFAIFSSDRLLSDTILIKRNSRQWMY